MTHITTEPSNMYYNATTGDIKEIIPFVGPNGIATAVIPEGYKRLSRLKALVTFTTASGVSIAKDTLGAYVCAKIVNEDGVVDRYTQGYYALEDIFQDNTKAWADGNTKVLDFVRFSGDVMIKSSTFKGDGIIMGSIYISSSTFTLRSGSTINFRKYRTISSATISGLVKLSGDITISSSTISTGNYELRSSAGLTIKSSKLTLKSNLTIGADFTLTSNTKTTLGGIVNGTLRIDTDSNSCIADINVNIDSTASIILGPRVNANGAINSYGSSTVTLANDVTLSGTITSRGSVTLKKVKALNGININAETGSTINLQSTSTSTSYTGSITTKTNASLLSDSLGLSSVVLSGSITCKGAVELHNNANIEGTHNVHNLQMYNNALLSGTLNSNSVATTVIIKNYASIAGSNTVKSNLTLKDRAKILENSSTLFQTNSLLTLGDDVQISGVCTIKGQPSILNYAQIKSCVLIDGTPTIRDNAIVTNIYCIDSKALIEDNATVGGDLYLTGDVAVGGNMYIVIQGPVDGDINTSRYDVNTIYNYGKFYFDWRVTAPYQMCLTITPLKEPIYLYYKSARHSETFVKLPDRENVISLASLSTELNMTIAYIADEKYKGRTNEDLKVEIGKLRRKALYYHLASTFMYHFCKTQNFDTTANVLELEPLTLFKC